MYYAYYPCKWFLISPPEVMGGAWEAETTREVPRERNMDLISIQVNVSRNKKRMAKRGVDIRAD